MSNMVHRTSSTRLESILRDGLVPDSPTNLTDCGTWAHAWYGVNPIFLANADADYLTAIAELAIDDADVVIQVDVKGFDLVADLPCLCDTGAYVEEGVLWWKAGREPPRLLDFLDADGGIEIEYLLDPSTDVCKAAIAVTGTAACLTIIPPNRLQLGPQPLKAPTL